MAAGDRLDGARARIDALDAEIQERIVERARVAQEVRDIKRAEGDLSDHYRPAREAQVLKAAAERNRALGSPLSDAAMSSIMREIMSACLALETPLSVSYLGPEGTYTQSAVYKHFGHQVSTRVAAAIDDIFRDVESGAASYGVVPVENSTEGVVTSTLDLLLSTPLSICGEVLLPVHHHLLSGFDAIERIDVVYAHPQSFAQCRRWLDNQLPNTPREPMPSNGAAARRVSETGRGAAIASAAAGVLYKLNALAANIEDDPNNTTRFLVIGRQQPEPTGADRTSLVCSAPQGGEPGALFSLLEPFAKAGVNLSKIESRPSRRAAWDYNFYLDLDGHQADPTVAQVIDDVRSRAAFFKILGSYPRATDHAG
ncbi:prephenate dehydratase [Algiphilus sp.]|uniref:prephenate dehydratase n=2 Tax=Algiphilus sp. TaxID=1872431 RepID=UPI0025C49A86|nr:prephenate dehydratase [Algiphilus sp.]MCK5770289.1 prephenate dehydratase [Algiphilus sp.]